MGRSPIYDETERKGTQLKTNDGASVNPWDKMGQDEHAAPKPQGKKAGLGLMFLGAMAMFAAAIAVTELLLK